MFQALPILAKSSVLDIWLGSAYFSDVNSFYDNLVIFKYSAIYRQYIGNT